jgi:hypothetical protein
MGSLGTEYPNIPPLCLQRLHPPLDVLDANKGMRGPTVKRE